jgi:hypothetical protein
MRPEDPKRRQKGTTDRGERATPIGLGRRRRYVPRWGGQREKKGLRGRHKSLKRLDPDKEIKVNSFDFLWLHLAGFCRIWGDLGLALKNQIAPP